MSRTFALTTMTAIALSACGSAPMGQKVIGVRGGSGGEIQSEFAHEDPLSRSQNWEPGAALPLVHIRTSLSLPMLARQALVAGGRVMTSAKRVELSGHSIMVSLTKVERELFLVGRAPSLDETPFLMQGVERALLDAVPDLTGCRHLGQVYRAGESRVEYKALAIPLSCK
ncbi:hypothetical protein A9Q94_07245 [Rhodobacterales bacterium 56_14_T64]|nr:hypothetical protein A9Q94_07245 [Rhodobacterales bacterium 56_14_T64]